MLCIYFYGTAIVAGLYIMAFCCNLSLEGSMIPIMDRQGKEFCNATFHEVLSSQLNCPGPNTTFACGEECARRRDILAEMGGCPLLNAMCSNYEYLNVGTGDCVATAGWVVSFEGVAMFLSPARQEVPQAECQRFCNADIQCVGFYHESPGVCVLATSQPPALGAFGWWHRDTVWTQGSISQAHGVPWLPTADATCYSKDTPGFVVTAGNTARRTAWLTLFAGVVLTMAAICGCALQYTLATRSKGKKGFGGLFAKMLCPCGNQGNRTDKFDEEGSPMVGSEDEDEEEGSELS